MTTLNAAAATGLPSFTLPPVPAADAQQLWSLHRAVHTIADVVDGLASQPRFAAREGVTFFNAAGEALATMSEDLIAYAEQIVEAARALPPGDGTRDDYRARLLLEHALAPCEDVTSVAEFCASVGALDSVRASLVEVLS